MDIKPLRKDLEERIREFGLEKKWIKAKRFFEQNIRHLPLLMSDYLNPDGEECIRSESIGSIEHSFLLMERLRKSFKSRNITGKRTS